MRDVLPEQSQLRFFILLCLVLGHVLTDHLHRWLFKEVVSLLLIAEQRENFTTQALVVGTFVIDEGRSRFWIDLQSGFKDRPDALPFFRGHARPPPRFISPPPHPLPEAHLPFTSSCK